MSLDDDAMYEPTYCLMLGCRGRAGQLRRDDPLFRHRPSVPTIGEPTGNTVLRRLSDFLTLPVATPGITDVRDVALIASLGRAAIVVLIGRGRSPTLLSREICASSMTALDRSQNEEPRAEACGSKIAF